MLSRFGLRPWMKSGVRILLILLLYLVLVSSVSVTFVEIRRYQTLVLPTPTGPYAVGRREYDWTDQSRYDPLAPHAGSKRELVVWAWYPALHEPEAEIASYLSSKWAQLSLRAAWLHRTTAPPEQRLHPDPKPRLRPTFIRGGALSSAHLRAWAGHYPDARRAIGKEYKTMPLSCMHIIQSCDTSRRKE